ncbi:81_t:CDS:1, partial [Racocetra fulgida]
IIEDCEKCKKNMRCDAKYPIICDNCLHEVLKIEFDNWTSGDSLIDELIRKAQLSLPYNRYPEWIPCDSFTEIQYIKGEFGVVISAKWSQGAKRMQSYGNRRHHTRSGPCKIILKKFMKQSLSTEMPLYCCLYGITQNISTSEYLLVDSTSPCDICLRKMLKSEFSNWSSGNLLIDEFIKKAQLSLPYNRHPEWIPYDSFTKIKYIKRDEFGAEWNQGARRTQSSNNEHYYIRSGPRVVVLKKLKDINQLSMIEIRCQDSLY